MRACLKHCGTTPEIKEVFMISVITGVSLSKQPRKRGEGIGSRSQDFFGILRIIWLTCPELAAWKVSSGIPEEEKTTESARWGVESRLLRIISIFSVKNSLNLLGRFTGEILPGGTVFMDVPIIWPLRRNSSVEELALTIFSDKNFLCILIYWFTTLRQRA